MCVLGKLVQQLTCLGFGADPYLNGALAVEAVTAIQSTGTITSVKVRSLLWTHDREGAGGMLK